MKTKLSLFFVLLFILCPWMQGHAAEYCTPTTTWSFGQSVRPITGVAIAGTTQSAPTLTAPDATNTPSMGTRPVYFDKTSEVINATQGDELAITLTYTIEWMHFYVYVDYNHDGEFDESNELVSFTYYSPEELETPDSKGVLRKNSYVPADGKLPSFIIPTEGIELGETRIRIKCDWNSKDPCGNPGEYKDGELKNQIEKNSGTIIDYTINIAEKVVAATYAVTFEQPLEGGTFEVQKEGAAIASGTEFEQGTTLSVVATPAEGYSLKAINVNGAPIAGEMFVVTTATAVSVEFEAEKVVEYCTPTISRGNEVGHITSAVTTGAAVNLNYQDTYAGGSYADYNKVVGSFSVQRGQEIDLTVLARNGFWGIERIFVDLNADGQFSGEEMIKKEGVTGQSDDNLANVTANFTVPEDIPYGKTLMRILFTDGDTQNTDSPCGAYIDGGFYDFEIEVKEAVASYAVTFGAAENGTFVIKNGDATISSGDQVTEGTTLTIETTPAENYLLKEILVNGEAISDNTFTVNAATTVEVLFEKEPEPTALTAIRVPGSGNYQFRFADTLLGTDGGSYATDQRIYNMTLSAWVKPLSTSGDILGHVQPNMYAETGSFAVRLKDGKLMLFTRCRDIGGGFPDDSAIRKQTETALTVGEWAFVTLAIDDTNKKMYLYKDGELVLEQDLNGEGVGLLHDSGMVFVAGHMNFNGDIDEVQVWNKTLTQNEVKASMGSYASTPDGLLYHYRFLNKAADNTFANLGMGGDCKGMVVSGVINDYGWWKEYVCSTQEPEMVQGHILAKYTLTYTSEIAGGSFVVKNGEDVVASGTELYEGTSLKVVVTSDEGYQVKAIKVNGEEIEGDTFNLSDDSEVTVELTNKLTFNCTYNSDGGSMIGYAGESPLGLSAEFDKGSDIAIAVMLKDGYELTTFTVNNADKKEELSPNALLHGYSYSYPGCNENLDVNAVFTKKVFAITYETPVNGTMTVKNGNTAVASGSNVEYGTVLTVTLTPNSISKLVSFKVNGVEKKDELVDNKMQITVEEGLTFAATFEEATFVLTWDNTTPNSGEVMASDFDGGDKVLTSGDAVTKGHYVVVTLTPAEGENVESLTKNGTAVALENNDDDLFIEDGVVTYWIEMAEDIDLKVAFTNTVGINTLNASVKAYYDAAAQTLNVAEGTATIYDLAGNAIMNTVEEVTNVAALKAGCYLVKVNMLNGSKTIKFIKK